jgi:hypothetical protein
METTTNRQQAITELQTAVRGTDIGGQSLDAILAA